MIALNRRYYKYGNNPVAFTVETSRIKVVIQYIGNLCHRSEKSNDSIATPVSLSFSVSLGIIIAVRFSLGPLFAIFFRLSAPFSFIFLSLLKKNN